MSSLRRKRNGSGECSNPDPDPNPDLHPYLHLHPNPNHKPILTLTRLGRMLWAAAFIMLVFLGLNACLTAAVVWLSRETKIEAAGTMLTKSGTLVEVGQQQTVLPLSSMLYLPRVFRSQLEHLTVKLKGSDTELDMKVQSTDYSPAPAPDPSPSPD